MTAAPVAGLGVADGGDGGSLAPPSHDSARTYTSTSTARPKFSADPARYASRLVTTVCSGRNPAARRLAHQPAVQVTLGETARRPALRLGLARCCMLSYHRLSPALEGDGVGRTGGKEDGKWRSEQASCPDRCRLGAVARSQG